MLKPPPFSGASNVEAVWYAVTTSTPPSVVPLWPLRFGTETVLAAEGPLSKTPLATLVEAPGARSPWHASQNSVIVVALPTSKALA